MHVGLGLNLTRGHGRNAALDALRGKQGFAIVPTADAVAVVDLSTPANNFTGSMAQAVDRGILVNASPPTKMLLNSSGILTSGSNLRCQYSAAGVPLGFLPEPQRTNLLLNSAALATQSVTVSATAYTLSFEGTGTVTLSGASTAGPLVGTGATDRVSLTFTPSAGSLTLTVSGTVNYANLEAGLFRTSPIVTAGSQVTRAADNLYVDLTKVPALGTEFTVLGEAEPCPDTSNTYFNIFSVYNSSNDYFVLRNGIAGASGLQFVNRNGGVPTGVVDVNSVVAASRFKYAAACKTDDFELVTDGVSRGTDTSGAMLSGATRLYIGTTGSGGFGGNWAAPIGFLALIPERLSQADMIARTS